MVLVLLAVPALSLLFMQNRQVQTMVSKYLTERLAEEFDTSITLSSVSYSFFRRIQVRDLCIGDIHGDTLIYAGLTKARVRQFRPEYKGITIRKVSIEDAYVNLVIDSTGKVNITYITDRLIKPHVPPELKTRVHIASIDLEGTRFSLTKMDRTPGRAPVDFTDYHLRDLVINVENLESEMDTVSMEVKSLSGVESSGFEIRELSTLLSISKRHLHLNELAIGTTGSDLNIPKLRFNFNSYKDFRRFSYRVNLDFETVQSNLEMNDLLYHVPWTGAIFDRITVDGKVNGKLNDLKGDGLELTFGDRSTLAFDFRMIGLPDVRNTFLDFNFRELNTSVHAVNNLIGTRGDTASHNLYPWINFGNLDFTGKFTGYPDHFVASGLLATDLGRMVMDLSFNPDSARGIGFSGQLRSNDFSLGRLFNQEKYLGQLDMNVRTEGHLDKGMISAELRGRIDTLEFYDYAYSNISLDGAFTNTTFDGGFSVTDPNIKLDFQGRTDFSGEIPEYRFTADVARARPHFLNLPQPDPNYFASFLLVTDLSGRTIDDLNGDVKLVNSLFEKTGAHVQLYDVTIRTRNNPEASLIQVRSDLADMDLTGQYRLSDLPRSFRNLGDRYLNIVPHSDPVRDTSNYFVFSMDFKHLNPLLDFFAPGVQVGDRCSLSGTYDLLNNNVRLDGDFPYIQYRENRWHHATAVARIGSSGFESDIRADSLTFGGGYAIHNQHFRITSFNDTARTRISWDNRARPEFSGEINMCGTFQPDSVMSRGFMVEVEPGEMIIDDLAWNIHPSEILLRKGYLDVSGFELSSRDRLVKADGVVSSVESDDFLLELENLNLGHLTGIAGINADISGAISGDLNYRRVDQAPVVVSNLLVDSLWFNDQFLGKTGLDAKWNNRKRSVRIRLLSEVEDLRIVDASGDYRPRDGTLDFDIRMKDFKLGTINPYTRGIASDLSGNTTVNLTLDGTLKKPELNGTIQVDQGKAILSYLNTRYHFNDRIRIYRNNFYLEDFRIKDDPGNSAIVNGSVSNTLLRDFYINLNIDARNLQCMNTTARDNEDFYGTIFGSGNVTISGPPDNIRLNVKATTDRNTALYLPLFNASEVVTSDFITFLSEEVTDEMLPTRQVRRFGGLKMDLEVGVTTDAVVQLIFDPKVGDIIETSGKGNLRIMLDQANGFRMFGDVELETGEYLFTLQNVINKKFKIEPGGRISFNGSPTNAGIDLKAIYTTRAAPYNLYPDLDDTRESLKKRIPVECHLNLQGELESPLISTGITMPTADAETRNLLENSTSTEEELMNQFLSLLVINNFYSVSGYGVENMGTMNSSIAGVTASELFSNQLSNWLSQINDDFDIGINYRPGDQITHDEVEVALSTQLLDDRIIISGNVDVGGQETNPSEGASNNPYIMGDFDVEFRVTDNVSVVAFNRARDELFFETGRYKQGVGVSYREEFDNLGELFARIGDRGEERRKRRKKPANAGNDE